MAHQLPNAINTAVNVLGTSGLLAARPAGHQRSREAAPDPVAAPPVSAELEVNAAAAGILHAERRHLPAAAAFSRRIHATPLLLKCPDMSSWASCSSAVAFLSSFAKPAIAV